MKVTVCGASGGIGQPLSLLLKMQLPPGTTLSLYDVVNVVGVAVDLSHVNTSVKVEPYQGDLKQPDNTTELEKALKDADVVIVPAGMPRKPGMTRDDLFKINAGIIKQLINAIAKVCPKALIGIITNPVNSTVPIAAEILKQHNVYNRNRLFGVSILDVVRSETFVAELKNLDAAKVKVHVIGGHSPETMLPVLSQVHGVSFTHDEVDALTKKIAEAGTVVVNAKDGSGSATLSMAYAGAKFAMALVRALQGETGIVECAYVQVDNMETRFFGMPVELGKDGIAKILALPKLSDYEQNIYKGLIDPLQKNIETGLNFAKL